MNRFFQLNRSTIKNHDIIPFVAKELKSIGWTMIFEANASDLFNAKKRTAFFKS